MGPKKKAADEGEDMSIDMFMKIYKNRLCPKYNVTPSKAIKERYE